MNPEIEYLPDECVNDVLDRELRKLLTTCFTKPHDAVFKERRYFREPYPYRWVIRNQQGAIVAHVGVHDKHIETANLTYRIGGIAEVCVHPDFRGHGYVRMTLGSVHEWLVKHGFDFAILFGDAQMYRSSGYLQVPNLFSGTEDKGWQQTDAMIRELSTTPWPSGEVHLPGPRF